MKGYDDRLKREPMFISKVIEGSFQSSQLYQLSLQVNNTVFKVFHLLIGDIDPPIHQGEVAFNRVTSKILTSFHQYDSPNKS